MQKETCVKKSKFYHNLFPKVQNLSSIELHEKLKTTSQEEHGNGDENCNDTNNVILIDVRTKSERKVSTIPGSISLADFERNHKEYLSEANMEVVRIYHFPLC